MPGNGKQSDSRISRYWRNLSPLRKVAVALGGVIGATLAGVAAPLILNAIHGGNEPHLRAEKLTVQNSVQHSVRGPVPKTGIQTKAPMPQAVLTIANTGDRRAVLTGLVFTVRDYAELDRCVRARSTPLAGHYWVHLPVPARPGQAIPFGHFDRNIAPDGVDRFALRFRVPSSCVGGEHLYILDVAAQVSGVATSRLGTIAMGVPGIPDLFALEGPPGAQRRRDLERIANSGATMDQRLKVAAQQATTIDAREGQ